MTEDSVSFYLFRILSLGTIDSHTVALSSDMMAFGVDLSVAALSQHFSS